MHDKKRGNVGLGHLTMKAPTDPIQIRPGEMGRLIVLLPYSPDRVAKLKTVTGRRWHPREKHWTVPHIDGTIDHLLALVAGEPVMVGPSLRPARVPDHWEPQSDLEIRHRAATAQKVKLLRQDGPTPPRRGG